MAYLLPHARNWDTIGSRAQIDIEIRPPPIGKWLTEKNYRGEVLKAQNTITVIPAHSFCDAISIWPGLVLGDEVVMIALLSFILGPTHAMCVYSSFYRICVQQLYSTI